MRAPQSQRGVTMVELLVVLAVLGLMAAVALPAFGGLIARSRMEGAANELRTDLQLARTESIRRQKDVSLIVAAGGTSYTISADAGATVIKTVSLPTNVSMSVATVMFDSLRGMADTTGAVDVSATGTSAKLRVSVNGPGKVSTCALSGSFYGVSTSC